MAKKDDFDIKKYHWRADIDYRKHPELYKVGKGEQGVLMCEPYKSEILPFWKFKNPELARESSSQIYQLFEDYLAKDDFVGADLARKFLQMGYTRARRYANYQGGRKYAKDTEAPLLRGTGEDLKAQSAAIFYEIWRQAEANEDYKARKLQWKRDIG